MCCLSLAFFSLLCDEAHVSAASYSRLDSAGCGGSISMSASILPYPLRASGLFFGQQNYSWKKKRESDPECGHYTASGNEKA
ncbi:uncharacterized [Tachysurus ichikawai]